MARFILCAFKLIVLVLLVDASFAKKQLLGGLAGKVLHKVGCDVHGVANRLVKHNHGDPKCDGVVNVEQEPTQDHQEVPQSTKNESHLDTRTGIKPDAEANLQPSQVNQASSNGNQDAQHPHEKDHDDMTAQVLAATKNELTLNLYNETKHVGETFVVACSDPSMAGVTWVGPNGVALNEQSKPSVTNLRDNSLILFSSVRVEDAGTYTCIQGLQAKKFTLFVDETPLVQTAEGKHILAVGSNCPNGYYYDGRKFCRQSLS